MFKQIFCVVLVVMPIAVLGYPKSYPVVQCKQYIAIYYWFLIILLKIKLFTKTGDSGAQTPLAIRVDNCPGPICEVKRGDPVNYEVDFITSKHFFLIKTF